MNEVTEIMERRTRSLPVQLWDDGESERKQTSERDAAFDGLTSPRYHIFWLHKLEARIVADYEAETITIQQPRRFGGTTTKPMRDFDEFPGDVREWVKSVRRSHESGQRQSKYMDVVVGVTNKRWVGVGRRFLSNGSVKHKVLFTNKPNGPRMARMFAKTTAKPKLACQRGVTVKVASFLYEHEGSVPMISVHADELKSAYKAATNRDVKSLRREFGPSAHSALLALHAFDREFDSLKGKENWDGFLNSLDKAVNKH